jgi:subtilisin family serine protease
MSTAAGFLKLAEELTKQVNLTAERWMPVAKELVQRRTGYTTAATEMLATPPKRYIVAPPAAQKSAGPNVKASLRSIYDQFQSSILHSEHEDGAKVMNMSALEAAVLKERYGNLVVEEDVVHRMTRSPLLPQPNVLLAPAAGPQLKLQVRGAAGAPVVGASVVLLTSVANNVGYEVRTDAQGVATVSLRPTDTKLERVIIDARAGYWSKVLNGVAVSALGTVDLTPLPIDGFGWGQLATEAGNQGANLGKGVKIAIIDSGIGQHPNLNVKGGNNFILNELASDWSKDDDGHGTHCAGVVAALQQAASTWGYAPNAEIYALRVFGGADGGGYAYDIGNAIKWAVDNGCDIVSMSLTAPQASAHIRKQIERANDAGVLCIAATGNEGGPVGYPAKFRDVVGVAAIGRFGAYPNDSLHATAESAIRSTDGQYFLASFSNRSPDPNTDDVDFCAPGVAVPSTLPGAQFGAWDGTSMACPHVSGMAALALASVHLKDKVRDADRRDLLLDRLLAGAVDLGMGRTYTGMGLPLLSKLL